MKTYSILIFTFVLFNATHPVFVVILHHTSELITLNAYKNDNMTLFFQNSKSAPF